MDRTFSLLPLPQIAAEQLEDLKDIIHSRQWDETLNDTWSYNWGTPNYSSRKAYVIFIDSPPSSNGSRNQAPWVTINSSSGYF
jgi:hypothetical protein